VVFASKVEIVIESLIPVRYSVVTLLLKDLPLRLKVAGGRCAKHKIGLAKGLAALTLGTLVHGSKGTWGPGSITIDSRCAAPVITVQSLARENWR